MPLAIDQSRLATAAQRVLGAAAPLPAKMMAASGIVPGAPAGDVVAVIAVLTEHEDAKVSAKARETIRKLPAPILNGALGADLEPAVLTLLADAYVDSAEVVERLLRMPRIDVAALEILASRADERIGEIVATNEERLLANPTVIEKLYMNKRVRMSTADRILELAVRNGLVLSIPAFKEAAQAIKNELIAEASEEPTYEDKLSKEATEIATKLALDASVEDTHVMDDEGEEQVQEKLLPLHARLAGMSISQKIRKATLGTSAERLLLVRDTNRLVAAAAVQSPMLNENEAARISASRQVSDDVLRLIAMNREWTRSYQIKLNLVMNPRTPFSFTSRLVPHLHDHDVRNLSKSKNVPGSVQQLARQQMARKQSGKKG
ncbi:MAG TPA: hypothetical protein VH062_08885 [Polyangiaceae bacterium]|jgi:hypothetical protein|nr:hypothetical protein [Polyangiaceae bacterium]